MDTDITEFEWLDPERVDAVGSPANGTPWLLVKSEGEEPVFSEDGMVKYVSASARRKYARQGVAMPNGDFPIPDEGHLRSAIGRLGNYHGDKAKAKRHIIKRARALGATHLLPQDWGVSKDMDTQAEDEDVDFPSPESTQGQTREMHPDAGPKSGSVSQDGGDPPAGRYSRPGPDLRQGDGLGDTAPSKVVPKAQAMGQTRQLTRKAGMTEGENQDLAAGGNPELDMTGDKAPNGEADAHSAEAEGESQTDDNKRKAAAGGGDQMRREEAQSQKAKRRVEGGNPEDTQPHSAQWEGKDAALAEGAHQLLEQAMELVQQFESREKAEIRSKKAIETHYPDIRRTAKLLTGLASGKVQTGPATKEIEDMTQDELIKLLDERDAARRKAEKKAEMKKARKAQKLIEAAQADPEAAQARQAKKAAKAAAKAAKAAGAALDTDRLTKGMAEALALAVKPLEDRLANVEGQPARVAPILNPSAMAAPNGPRTVVDATAFKALEDRVAAAQTPAERQRAGAELLKAKMIAAERLREAQGKTGQPVALLSR